MLTKNILSLKLIPLILFLLSNSFILSIQAQEAPPNDGGNTDGGNDGRGNGGRRNGGRGSGDGGNGGRGNGGGQPRGTINDLENAHENLQLLINELTLEPTTTEGLNLPSITDAKAQLGKQLFFAKNLGGEQSAACVSCHHPMLGGGDDLSLSVGVSAVNFVEQSAHDLLGTGRFNGISLMNLPSVPRNSPTIFNLGLNTRRLFWDGRVEARRNGAISTPDSTVNDDGRRRPDNNLPQGATLAAAQARFPVTSPTEMRGEFSQASDNQTLRSQLAERFTDSDSDFPSHWPAAFAVAYPDDNVSFDRIAESIGEYERSMVFINNPWNDYLKGDDDALTAEQKAGAVLFFTRRRDGGAGCVNCHRGSTFSRFGHQLTAYPQFGPGKGNDSGSATSNDFGRENVSNNIEDRYHFRTPSLLNVALTAPYGHTGAYQTLNEVVSHYQDPRQAINRLFGEQNAQALVTGNEPFCRLPQVADLMIKNNQSCADLYPDAYANSIAAVTHLEQARNDEVPARFPLRRGANLSDEQVSRVVAFLHALTDPCIESRECLAPWIVDESNVASFPDDSALIAEGENGGAL